MRKFLAGLALLLALALPTTAAVAQYYQGPFASPVSYSFTASGTLVVPANKHVAIVNAVSGGGGYADSAVSSALFTITNAPTGSLRVGGNESVGGTVTK